MTSVWVSNLPSPPCAADIKKYFSHIGELQDVIIPDPDGHEAFVLFQEEAAAAKCLKYDGKPFRDRPIEVSRPTESQLLLLSSEKERPMADTASGSETSQELLKRMLMQMAPTEMMDMLSGLTDWAKVRVNEVGRSKEFDLPKPRLPQSSLSQDAALGRTLMTPLPNLGSHPAEGTPTYGLPPAIPYFAMQTPRIIFFSGDEEKGESNYLQWRNEVQCLMSEGQPVNTILQGIRRSLKGTAAEVLLNMGDGITPTQIINKFDVIFGSALSAEAMLEEFYRAKQKPEENVVVWGCHLETLLSKVKRQSNLGGDCDEMLRTKFWSGLKDDHVRNGIRHKYDAGIPFSQLLVAAKTVEYEQRTHIATSANPSVAADTKKKSSTAHVQVQKESAEDKLDELLKKMDAMGKRIQVLEKQHSVKPKSGAYKNYLAQPETRECFYCHNVGHIIKDCVLLQKKNQKGNGQ